MMKDTSKLGFRIDTQDLERTTEKLEKFAEAAKRAADAAQELHEALEGPATVNVKTKVNVPTPDVGEMIRDAAKRGR